MPSKSITDIWEDLKSNPHKTKTLIPWIGPIGEWSFFYHIREDGKHLVIETDKIHDIIGKYQKDDEKTVQYLLDILSWKRSQQIDNIIDGRVLE
jgi:hypothetical protein